MLELDQIAVAYGPKQVVHGVSLKAGEGEIVAILGNNGAGKSTTLKAICGLVHPWQGTIRFQGETIHQRSTKDIVRLGIGYVPEGRGVFPEMSVYENLLMGGYSRRKSKALMTDMEAIYALFPRLKEREKQLAGSLSGGEQQMLAIGRALMAKPKLLILDEPSLGIAPLVVKLIAETIQELNQKGTTIVLVEQNADLALQLANRAYIVAGGRVVLEGEAEKLRHDDKLIQAYLGGMASA